MFCKLVCMERWVSEGEELDSKLKAQSLFDLVVLPSLKRQRPPFRPILPTMFSLFSGSPASSSTTPSSIPTSPELPTPSASTPSPPPPSSSSSSFDSKKAIPVLLDQEEEKAFESWREGLRHFTGLGKSEEDKALAKNRAQWGACEDMKTDAFLWSSFLSSLLFLSPLRDIYVD